MINEFIDYDLTPSMAWSNKHKATLPYGDILIEYGANCLVWFYSDESIKDVRINYWTRATIFPKDRYFPIWIPQEYSENRAELVTSTFAQIRTIIDELSRAA